MKKTARYDIEKLIQIRKDKGISQKELAELTSLGIATIQRIEQKGSGSFENIVRICNALNTPVPIIGVSRGESLVPSEIESFDTPLDFEKAWIKRGGAPHYGSEIGRSAALLVTFESLNEAGQRTALDLLELVQKVPEYNK